MLQGVKDLLYNVQKRDNEPDIIHENISSQQIGTCRGSKPRRVRGRKGSHQKLRGFSVVLQGNV